MFFRRHVCCCCFQSQVKLNTGCNAITSIRFQLIVHRTQCTQHIDALAAVKSGNLALSYGGVVNDPLFCQRVLLNLHTEAAFQKCLGKRCSRLNMQQI